MPRRIHWRFAGRMVEEYRESVDPLNQALRHRTPQRAAVGVSGETMNRRVFLKLTGLVAVAGVGALPFAVRRRSDTVPAVRAQDIKGSPGTRLTIREPGTYRISGHVRLDEPLVEISGIQHTQRISWSGLEGSARPVASFTTFEHFDGPGMTRMIHVRGGHLEAVTAVPVDFV